MPDQWPGFNDNYLIYNYLKYSILFKTVVWCRIFAGERAWPAARKGQYL
jgi:hypothetical protein